jgi:hypothetical protein
MIGRFERSGLRLSSYKTDLVRLETNGITAAVALQQHMAWHSPCSVVKAVFIIRRNELAEGAKGGAAVTSGDVHEGLLCTH